MRQHAMAMHQTCYVFAATTDTPFALYCHQREEIDAFVHAAHAPVFDMITTTTIASSKATLPPRQVLAGFEKRVSPLFHGILAGTTTTRTSANLRDALPHKLIFGELRLRDAERFIARVGL